MNTIKYDLITVENNRTVIYEFDCEGRIEYELSLLEKMSDEEVCRIHRVDSREDAKAGIIEYWKYIA